MNKEQQIKNICFLKTATSNIDVQPLNYSQSFAASKSYTYKQRRKCYVCNQIKANVIINITANSPELYNFNNNLSAVHVLLIFFHVTT